MTSRENNNATEKFFEKNDFFGLPYEDVKFFKQGELPMVDVNGKLLVERYFCVRDPEAVLSLCTKTDI